MHCPKCEKSVMHYCFAYRHDPIKYCKCNYCGNVRTEMNYL